MDDQTAAEWITRQYLQPLDEQQAAALQAHLAQSAGSRRLAELCAQIDKAVVQQRGIEAGSSSGAGLSDVTRQRIQRLLEQELAKLALPGQGDPGQRRVAEGGVDYRPSDPPTDP